MKIIENDPKYKILKPNTIIITYDIHENSNREKLLELLEKDLSAEKQTESVYEFQCIVDSERWNKIIADIRAILAPDTGTVVLSYPIIEDGAARFGQVIIS